MSAERVTVARVTLLSPFAARRLIAEFRAHPNRSRSRPSALAVVTERKREVLVLVAERRSYDDIAAELCITAVDRGPQKHAVAVRRILPKKSP